MEKEILKPINWISWLEKDKYYVSNLGNIYNKKLDIMSISYTKGGYATILLRDINKNVNCLLISKLVLQAFKPIEDESNRVCIHLDNNPKNNNINNLEWGSIQEAIQKRNRRSENITSINNEIKKPINWIENIPKNTYYISNFGNIYNKIGYKMSTYYSNGGYECIVLRNGDYKTHQFIHRLVLQAFKPIFNESEMTVDHIDGDILNNNLLNLQWLSITDNVLKRETNNRFRDNHINYFEKMNKVLELVKQGVSYKEIYLRTGMNRNYINRCIKENHIDKSQYNQGNHKFNINTLFELVLVFCFNDLNNVELGKIYNCDKNSISNLRNCKTYSKDLASLGYTKTHKPYSIIDYEYNINDINQNSEYTFLN